MLGEWKGATTKQHSETPLHMRPFDSGTYATMRETCSHFPGGKRRRRCIEASGCCLQGFTRWPRWFQSATKPPPLVAMLSFTGCTFPRDGFPCGCSKVCFTNCQFRDGLASLKPMRLMREVELGPNTFPVRPSSSHDPCARFCSRKLQPQHAAFQPRCR